jgi:hypothetical protein
MRPRETTNEGDSKMKNWRTYIDVELATGEITTGELPEWENGVPARVWHGLIKRFHLPADKKVDDTITDWFAKTFEKEIATLRDGFNSRHDGSNWVGAYENEEQKNEAGMAEYKIEDDLTNQGITDLIPGVTVWYAREWFSDGVSVLGITGKTTDAELKKIIETEKENADYENVHVPDLEEWLTDERDELIEDDE